MNNETELQEQPVVKIVDPVKDNLLKICELNKKHFVKEIGQPFYDVIEMLVNEGDINTAEKLNEILYVPDEVNSFPI